MFEKCLGGVMDISGIRYICDLFGILHTNELEAINAIDNRLEILSVPEHNGNIVYHWLENPAIVKKSEEYGKIMYLNRKNILKIKMAYPYKEGFKLIASLTDEGRKVVKDFFLFYKNNQDLFLKKKSEAYYSNVELDNN